MTLYTTLFLLFLVYYLSAQIMYVYITYLFVKQVSINQRYSFKDYLRAFAAIVLPFYNTYLICRFIYQKFKK